MYRLLCCQLERNRYAMRRLLFFLASCLLVIAPVQLPSVQAQSCAQGGPVICGPNCNIYFNILYDPFFEQTDCSQWEFDWGTERAYGTFWGYTSHFGRFIGPANRWHAIAQTTTALPAGSGNRDSFSFRYEVQIVDPLNDPSTIFEAYIIEPNGYPHPVGRFTGAQAYQSLSFSLGNQPSWVGQTLRVEFWAYQPGNSTISIDNVALWQ